MSRPSSVKSVVGTQFRPSDLAPRPLSGMSASQRARELERKQRGWCAIAGSRSSFAKQDLEWYASNEARDKMIPLLLKRFESTQRQEGAGAGLGKCLGTHSDVGAEPCISLDEHVAEYIDINQKYMDSLPDNKPDVNHLLQQLQVCTDFIIEHPHDLSNILKNINLITGNLPNISNMVEREKFYTSDIYRNFLATSAPVYKRPLTYLIPPSSSLDLPPTHEDDSDFDDSDLDNELAKLEADEAAQQDGGRKRRSSKRQAGGGAGMSCMFQKNKIYCVDLTDLVEHLTSLVAQYNDQNVDNKSAALNEIKSTLQQCSTLISDHNAQPQTAVSRKIFRENINKIPNILASNGTLFENINKSTEYGLLSTAILPHSSSSVTIDDVRLIPNSPDIVNDLYIKYITNVNNLFTTILDNRKIVRESANQVRKRLTAKLIRIQIESLSSNINSFVTQLQLQLFPKRLSVNEYIVKMDETISKLKADRYTFDHANVKDSINKFDALKKREVQASGGARRARRAPKISGQKKK